MNIAILLSGGTGTRLGGEKPKQYLKAGDFMVISYAIKPLLVFDLIDVIVIVAHEEWRWQISEEIERLDSKYQLGFDRKQILFADPGENRQLSILSGMEKATGGDGQHTIFIHDAARPMLSLEQIEDCYKELPGHDGVMPVLPMKDTVYFSEDGKSVSRLLERERIFAGQAPELFQFEPYYEATRALLPNEILKVKGSTEVAIRAGLDVVMIPGDERNFKITTMPDLDRFRGFVEK